MKMKRLDVTCSSCHGCFKSRYLVFQLSKIWLSLSIRAWDCDKIVFSKGHFHNMSWGWARSSEILREGIWLRGRHWLCLKNALELRWGWCFFLSLICFCATSHHLNRPSGWSCFIFGLRGGFGELRRGGTSLGFITAE